MKALIAALTIAVLNLAYVIPASASPYGVGCYGTNVGGTVGSRTNFGTNNPIGDIAPAGGNGVVNVFDYVTIKQLLGTSISTGFSCEGDLKTDTNNIVNIFDLVIFKQHLGEFI